MGLDITAYRGLKLAPDAELDTDGEPVEWDRFVKLDHRIVDTEKHWPGRCAPLKPGVYQAVETMGFRAGSYGGYNEWRDWLARAAGYRSARSLWEKREQPGPFAELINFSDCEGVIGATVAAKLARDFADHEARICAQGDEWEATQYRKWRAAFEMAADGGCVEFH